MSRTEISVVIPTMNRPDTLKITLESYIHSDVLPNQIVIVDQTENYALRKEQEEMIKQYCKLTNIVYFYQQTPSLTKARNVGLNLCKNDIVIYSDDDITVQTSTIKNVVDIMRNPQIAMIAGINSRDGYNNSRLSCLFGKKSYIKRNIGHVTNAVYGRFPEKKVTGTVATEWAMGFFFVVRKSLIEKWDNYWDENLISYAYGEDLDFSYSYFKRASAENMICVLDERIVVEHRVSNEWRVPSRKSTMMLVINREYLRYKHHMGRKSWIFTRWANFGEYLMRIMRKAGAKDLLDAQRVCDAHRKELASGIIKPEWYQ